MEQTLELSSNADVSTRAKALYRAAELCVMFEDGARTKQYCNEALVLARQVNDKQSIAWALGTLALIHDDRMATLGEQSLALFREIGDTFGLSHLLRRRAWSAIHEGDYPYARALLDEALGSARRVGDGNAIAWSLCLLGVVVWWQDQNPRQTAALLQESVSEFREFHNISDAYTPLVMLARVEQVMGNERRAETLYKQALALVQNAAMTNNGILLPGLGSLAAGQGRLLRAARLLGAAEADIPGMFGFFPVTTFESDVASLRIQLGEDVFTTAWAEGKAMTWEQAVPFSLRDTPLSLETEHLHQDTNHSLIEPLSARELDVLRLVAEGYTNQDIADRLYIGVSTVKKHINHLYDKLDAKNRTQAVARARECKMLTS